MIHIATPLHKTPRPDSNEIYKLARPFLGHFCFILNMSDPCPSMDKKRRKNIACSPYDHAPSPPTQETLPPGGLKITIFVDSYLVIIIIYLEEEKRIFKEIK